MAGEPRDYAKVEEESPREAMANLCHELRALSDPSGGAYTSVAKTTLATWASRLENAVRKLDAEKAGALTREESDIIRRELRDGTPNTPQRVEMIRHADEILTRGRPLEDEKASQRP